MQAILAPVSISSPLQLVDHAKALEDYARVIDIILTLRRFGQDRALSATGRAKLGYELTLAYYFLRVIPPAMLGADMLLHASGPGKDCRDSRQLLHARIAPLARRCEEAILMLNLLLEEMPADNRPRIRLAELLSSRDPAAAIQLLEDAVDRQFREAPVAALFEQLGRAGRTDEARRVAEQGDARFPGSTRLTGALANARMREGGIAGWVRKLVCYLGEDIASILARGGGRPSLTAAAIPLDSAVRRNGRQ